MRTGRRSRTRRATSPSTRPATVEAVKLGAAIFRAGMTDEVFAWDAASNNRFLAGGQGSLDPQHRLVAPGDREAGPRAGQARSAYFPTPSGPAGPLRRPLRQRHLRDLRSSPRTRTSPSSSWWIWRSTTGRRSSAASPTTCPPSPAPSPIWTRSCRTPPQPAASTPSWATPRVVDQHRPSRLHQRRRQRGRQSVPRSPKMFAAAARGE